MPAFSIRLTTPADTPALLTQGARFWRALPYAHLFPEARLDLLQQLIERQGRGWVATAAGVDGPAIVGMLGGAVYTHPLFHALTFEELVWWADPAYRAAGVGVALLTAAEAWARAQGARLVAVKTPAGTRARGLAGYHAIELLHVKVLPGPEES